LSSLLSSKFCKTINSKRQKYEFIQPNSTPMELQTLGKVRKEIPDFKIILVLGEKFWKIGHTFEIIGHQKLFFEKA